MRQSTPTVRDLKGSPLSVFCAMLVAKFEGRLPVGEKYLQAESGWTQNPVRLALMHLENLGIVTRHGKRYDAWTLTDYAYQLPLTVSLMNLVTAGAPGQLDPGTTPSSSGAIEAGESQQLTLDLPTTATTTISRTTVTEEAAAETKRESQKLTLPTPAYTANLEALHKAGIMGRKAEELAHLDHLNPAYVQAHFAHWLCEHNSSGTKTGILVVRLRDGDPAPEPCDDQEERERKSRRRYIEGELAQYIQH